MYVDLVLLFLIYSFSAIALAVSIYALWTLKELEIYYKNRRVNKPTQQKPVPPTIKKRQGHWD